VSTPLSEFRLGYRPALDGFRGLAVLLVMVGHLATFSFLHAGGTIGVIMFFVLSGFLITRLLLEEREEAGRVSLRDFYLRRVLRLLPAVALLMAFAAIFLRSHPGTFDGVRYTFLYVANIFKTTGHSLGLLNHTWSLSQEEQFYFAWPFVLVFMLWYGARFGPRNTIWFASGLALASAAWRFVLADSPRMFTRVYYAPDTRMDAILLGCVLALVVGRFAGRRALGPLALLGGAALLFASRADNTSSLCRWWFLPVAVASAVVIVYLVSPGESKARALLASKPFSYTGKISYGLYLWHYPIFRSVQPHVGSWPGVAQVLFMVGLAYGAASASFYLWERPFLRLKARFARHARSERATAEWPASPADASPETSLEPQVEEAFGAEAANQV
jgi:peptidoglycan/LPS O-acetylase OafA/YrhL